ncbi:hypothetical protein MKZ38_008359 [Zalerion maritima]|uniref:Fe2OG dioxygenase domain-containing protein n=1 Tax=Zalerion maritima TaxID=339359 RepID=A0AAD5RVY1_9PEZI|nr:hypothetical protein MKZ38_008359 [Zalerion maritima]
MASLQYPQEISGEQLLRQVNEAITQHPSNDRFSCDGSLDILRGSDYADFTSTKKPVTCPSPVIFWTKGAITKRRTFDPLWGMMMNRVDGLGTSWGTSLDELVQDCSPAKFGFDDKDVFDETVRKAGVLDASRFSTNFNPYDFGIVDAVARELLPGVVRAGKQPAVERWGVVAELYKLNVYSEPSGMFKPHVDTPRGKTHFGSLVVVLPTEFQGGQLRLAHKGKERVYLDRPPPIGLSPPIRWVAFYSDCEHEVLPVVAGHRVTLTYKLYVSERIGGLVQPQVTESETCPMYCRIKDLLASPMFMTDGGILGFHCAYQYPATHEGTEYYARYPRVMKGIDFIIFAVFRALGLTVHIQPYENGKTVGGQVGNVRTLLQDLRTSEIADGRPAKNKFKEFERHYYVGDEIFQHAKWFNEQPTTNPGGAGWLGDAKPTHWIGNETDVDWDYSFRALLVVSVETDMVLAVLELHLAQPLSKDNSSCSYFLLPRDLVRI